MFTLHPVPHLYSFPFYSHFPFSTLPLPRPTHLLPPSPSQIHQLQTVRDKYVRSEASRSLPAGRAQIKHCNDMANSSRPANPTATSPHSTGDAPESGSTHTAHGAHFRRGVNTGGLAPVTGAVHPAHGAHFRRGVGTSGLAPVTGAVCSANPVSRYCFLFPPSFGRRPRYFSYYSRVSTLTLIGVAEGPVGPATHIRVGTRPFWVLTAVDR